MTPGTVIEVTDGVWKDRVGEVESMDPEWTGVGPGVLYVRLYAVAQACRPRSERVVVREADVRAVDLRGRG